MGEVVSIAKARQTDIFSMFDAACPSLPEEASREVIETALRSVGGAKSDKTTSFRAACIVIAVISLFGLALSYFNSFPVQQRASMGGEVSTQNQGRQAMLEMQYAVDGAFSSNLVETEEFTLGQGQSDNPAWRHSRESWLAEISSLESHPYYQQVVREKRLFSLAHPDQSE